MKIFPLLLLFISSFLPSHAQLRFSGKVLAGNTDSVALNPGWMGWFQPAVSTFATLEKDSTFSFELPVNQPQFMRFCYSDDRSHWIMLVPGKPLHVVIRPGKAPVYSGSGAMANEWLQDMESYPGFRTKFAALPDTVNLQRLYAIVKTVDSVEQHVSTVIQVTKLSTIEKNMLQAELHFHYARRLHELRYEFRNYWGNPLWEQFEDSLIVRNRLPSLEEIQWSPAAAGYLATYADWQFGLLKRVYVKDKQAAQQMLDDAFGVPMDSLRTLERMYGDAYLNALYLHKRMPAPQHERLLVNAAIFHSNAREADEALAFGRLLDKYYPNSKSVAEVRPYLQRINAQKEQGVTNNTIRVLDNGASIDNLEQLLAPYRGKLVYLDIWGTWCGACMEEIQYSHALKKQMAGEDVVFLYISNDVDKLDQKWRNYIYTNNITGTHLRMAANIERIWKELVTGEVRRYPGHFLFDREGERIPQQAVSPMQTVELRKQLRSLL